MSGSEGFVSLPTGSGRLTLLGMSNADRPVVLRNPVSSAAGDGMTAAMGTMSWAAPRGGALTVNEQLACARAVVLAQIRSLPGQLRAQLGRGGRSSVLADHRPPPDSALARQTLELARGSYLGPLLGHCLRCWLWADLFAQLDGVAPDVELLYASCLLHDLGLTDGHRAGPDDPAQCFAVHGAGLATDRLRAWGMTDSRARRVGDAIAAHMNPRLDSGGEPEAHLLHAAAQLDVAGLRASELPDRAVRHVLERHPRDGFSTAFAQQMRREATERPRSRAALMWRLGMPVAIAINPLDHARG